MQKEISILMLTIAQMQTKEQCIDEVIKAANEAKNNPSDRAESMLAFNCSIFMAKLSLKENSFEEMIKETSDIHDVINEVESYKKQQ